MKQGESMAIFKDASQAVRFSFMIEAYPSAPASAMQRAMNTASRSAGKDRRRAGVDFSGMTGGEMRYECLKIRQSVRKCLNDIEAAALEARFSSVDAEKINAVAVIALHLEPRLKATPQVIDSLARRHYQSEEWSIRALAARHGISKDRALRLAKIMEREIKDLEAAAIAKLQVRFEDGELVDREV